MSAQLNLMSAQANYRATVRAGVRFWLKAYLVSAAAMSFTWGLSWWDCKQATEKLAQFESHYEPIKQLKISAQAKRDQIAAINEHERVALALAANRPALTLVGTIGQSAAASSGDVYVKHFDVRQDVLTATGRENASIVQLRGLGRDDSAVAEFVNQLRGNDLFSKVELKSTQAKHQGKSVVREFTVECKL